jgi:hypothetical protein
MNEQAEFADHIEMQKYAERNGLDYAWSGTAVFAKRERALPPDQLEVRAVLAMRIMVGLFSAAITRAEREADALGRPWRRNGWPGKHGPRSGWRVHGAPENWLAERLSPSPLCQCCWQ